MQSESIRAAITNRIIESLKQGRIPWRRPWKVTGVDSPLAAHESDHPEALLGHQRPDPLARRPGAWLRGRLLGDLPTMESVGSTSRKARRPPRSSSSDRSRRPCGQADGTERLESFPLLRTFPVFSIHQVEGGVAEKFLNPPCKADLPVG